MQTKKQGDDLRWMRRSIAHSRSFFWNRHGDSIDPTFLQKSGKCVACLQSVDAVDFPHDSQHARDDNANGEIDWLTDTFTNRHG
ncbi:hypothetical protein TNCT_151941 [Trichonephila clavata]|uniref:Uncharacterized protein n=1 Tax=Trichonephila clavata TaxID=2740835 RepID=A0A8X6LZM3_TRICU|nr:hypothetical protein TNCT_151941 [Trichonephila clavata]